MQAIEPKELAGVGEERLDDPPLPFGIERIERERGFPRAGDPGDHHEIVARDRDADIFEVVLTGTFDDDIFHVRVVRQSAPVVKGVQFRA